MNVLKKWWNKKPKPERTTPHTDKWHTIISASLTLLAISYFSAVHQDGFFSGFAVLFVSILGLSTGVGIARLQYRNGTWIPIRQRGQTSLNGFECASGIPLESHVCTDCVSFNRSSFALKIINSSLYGKICTCEHGPHTDCDVSCPCAGSQGGKRDAPDSVFH